MEGAGQTLARYDKTNRTLLETIEGKHPSIDEDGMAELLKRNHERFLKNLSTFEPGSTKSLEKIRSGKVEIGGKTQTINASEREFVAKLSQRLDLDAVEALKIFRNFMKYEATGRFEYDAEASMREIMAYYYSERRDLLRCVRGIIRVYIAEDSPFSTAASEEYKRLMETKYKFGDFMLKQFLNLCEAPVPKQRLEGRQDQEAWAYSNLEEQILCLEILFLIYYSKDPEFDPDRLLSYARLLKKHVEWDKQHPLLGEGSRPIMNRICIHAILLLLVLFGLENISEDGDESPGRMAHPPVDLRQRFDKEFEHWMTNRAHGPLLLAWACTSQYKFRGNFGSSFTFLHRARELNVIPFLTEALGSFDSSNPILAGYKSVANGLLGAALTCFDLNDIGDFDHILRFHYILFHNEASLANQFLTSNWRTKKNLLYHVSRANFPHEFDPFLKVSQSLAADGVTARFMFENVLSMDRFTVSRSELPTNAEFAAMMPSPAQPRLEHRMVLRPIYLPGLVIPAETRGRVHHVDGDEIIQFAIKYSAWTYFMGKINVLAAKLSDRQPTSTIEITQVTQILRLMNQLFSKNDQLAGTLQKHLKEAMGRNVNLLRQLFTLLRKASNLASSSPVLLEMLDACVRCINCFASSHPLQVWEEMRRGGVLQEMSSSIKNKTDGDIRQILAIEQRNGFYPITISFLNLLFTLLSYARKWHLVSGRQTDMMDDEEEDAGLVSLEDFHPCLSFIKADLFARYESWRYKQPRQKTKIGIKIMNIFIDVLSEDSTKTSTGWQASSTAKGDTDLPTASPMSKTPGGTPSRSLLYTPLQSPARGTADYRQIALSTKRARRIPLKESLLVSLLDDRSFHKVLLSNVAIGLRPLEVLRAQHRVKEEATLRRLLLKSLNILERVLQSKETLQANEIIPAATSSLEHFLLSTETTVSANALYASEDLPAAGLGTREAKEVHVIAVIAAYINNKDKSADLPLYATRLLSLLCSITLDSGFAATGARPPSLVGYLGTQAEAVRDAYMTKLNDPLTNENLRVAILQLVEKTLRHQPGLALLFINIDAQKPKEKCKDDNVQESHSCLKIVRKMLANNRQNLSSLPRLFAEVVSLLASLWQAAPSHQSIIKVLRDSPDFWKQLTETLCASIEKHLHGFNALQQDADGQATKSPGSAKGKERLTDLDVESVPLGDVCYQVAIGANVLQILAQEVFHVDDVSDQLDASLREQLRLLNSKEKQDRWFADIAKYYYDRRLLDELKEQVKVLVRTTTHRDVPSTAQDLGDTQGDLSTVLPVTEGERIYGVNYHYDARLLQNKLSEVWHEQESNQVPSTPARGKQSEFNARSFLVAVHKANNMLSLLDVQLDLLYSWRSFIEITGLKQPSSSLLAAPQASASLIQQLAAALQSEDKKDKAIDQRLHEMANLLLFLLKHHYARGSRASVKGKEKDGENELFSAATVANAIKETLLRRRLLTDIDVPLTSSLLGSLLVLLRASHNDKSAQALSDVVLPLLPQALELIQRAEFNHTIIAILDALTLKTKGTSHLNVYSKLVVILNHALNLEETETSTAIAALPDESAEATAAMQALRAKQKTAEIVLHLILSMSSDPIMTETLALAGIIRVLSNNSLRAFQEMHHTYTNGKRNVWHRLWCLILTFTTAVLRTLTYSEVMVDQAIEFLAIHNALISRTIERPAAAYTLAQLEEAEMVTSFVYELGTHWKEWRFSRGKLANHYRDRVLMLVNNLVIVLQSEQMSLFAQPVTKRQKMLLQPIDVKSDVKEKAAGNGDGATERKAQRSEAAELRPFYLVVASRMHHILRNCLSFLRVVGPQLSPTLLTNRDRLEHIDWDAFRPLFEDRLSFEAPSLPLPAKRTGPRESGDEDDMLLDGTEESPRAGSFSMLFGDQSSRPTLGLLVKGVLHVCAAGIKEGVSREGQPSKLLVYTASLVDQLTSPQRGTRGDAANRLLYKVLKKVSLQLQDQHEVLYTCMQVSLYMILSHLVIFIHGKNKISDRVKVDLGMEMETFFGRLVRDLTHKRERGDLAEEVPEPVVADYIGFFSATKSYFEQLLNTWAASQKGYGLMSHGW